MEQPPPDHESDQEELEDKSSSEVNQRADQMELIKEFQEAMNKAIEQLLNKPVRRHSTEKINLSHAWDRESIRKPDTKKQKCFH